MKYLNLHIVRLLLMALLVLPATTSCYDYDHTDIDDYTPEAKNLINVTVTVSASNIAMTRANSPLGGEDGDGREVGIEPEENKVTGVTLVFFQDAANTTAGINATLANAQSTTIDYAVYYPVSRDDTYIPYTGVHLPGEIYYTTGDKELDDNLDPKKKYHMLVVANANLTSDITAGTTTLAQVRDKVLPTVYSAESGFVMSSEKDHVINFDYSTYDKTTNRRTFHLDNVHLERMSARIDFWAAYSNGYKTSDDNAAYTTPGYEYTVKKPDGTDSQDRFVLTSITPFNLNIGNGNEYLFKRTNDATNPYLADETTSNWVVDPYTSTKTTAAHPSWMASTLTSVEANMANDYNISMAGSQSGKLTIDNSDDIVLAYPKENTLNSSSLLYYYATGLAFEGYYYKKGTGTGDRRVYYYFIRHQGESNNAYMTFTSAEIGTEATKALTCPASPAMNFGIVRNNIYRISVNQVTDGGILMLNIAVHDWRNVLHPEINI